MSIWQADDLEPSMKESRVYRDWLKLAYLPVLALLGMLAAVAVRSDAFAGSAPVVEPAFIVPSQVQADCTAGGSATVARHTATGAIRFAGTNAGQTLRAGAATATPEQAARNFLAACGALFGIADPHGGLTVTRERADSDGRSNVRYQQTYHGVPILGAELLVNLDAVRGVTSIAGEGLPDLRVNTQPQVDAATARRTALERLAEIYGMDATGLTATEPTLWVYNPALLRPGGGLTSLVWRMEVTHADELEIRALVLVNAHRGNVELEFNQTESARNRMTYSANNGTLLPGTLRCNEGNSACAGDAHAVAAHKFAGQTYDFYMNNFGRDSLDGAGMTLVSTVHYANLYSNSLWNGSQVIYGDGAGLPLADDIVAHELTHGITQFEAGLFNYYQSGAINESLSDVFGELMDLTNGEGTDTAGVKWQLGEDIGGGGALRDMKNPGAFGHPDRMTGPNYFILTCLNFSSECDNGGVHINSGVNNKAAYLLVDGDTFNGKTVTGLGIIKTAKIYYEAQRNLLWAASDYADLYNALYQACQNLIAGGITNAADCQEVRDATDAVEMNSQPVLGYNPDAAICPSGTPNNIFFDDLEAGPGNWSFGGILGPTHWSYDSPYASSQFPYSGEHYLYGDDYSTSPSDSFVAMNASVALPAGAYLHFFHAYGFDDPNKDGGIVEYSTNGGSSWKNAIALFEENGYDGTLAASNPLGAIPGFLSDSRGYISSRLNLAPLEGQSVRFRWRLGADASVFDHGWFLDNIRIYTCGIPGPVTVTQVRVTDKNNLDQDQFYRGDKVFYRVTLHNAGTAPCSLTVRLRVKNKQSQLADVTKSFTVNPGDKNVKIKEKVPIDAPFLQYKAKATSNCNGQKDSGKDKFSVVP